MIGTSQLINTFSRPCFTDTTDIFKDGSGVALYGLDYDASDAGGASGKFGEAAIFNGSSSIISIPQPTLSGGFTLSAWFRTTSSAFQSIITMGGSSAAAGLNIFTNSGNVITSFGNGSSEDYNAPTSSVIVNTGAWFHVVLSTSGLSSGSTVKLYINGQLDDSETSSVSINTTSYTSAFSIGGRNLSGSLSTYFNGSIDQVRIFNTELTQSQVTQLYQENNSTVGTHLFGCIANYNLDGSAKESMGTTAYDGTETDITYRYDGTPTAVDFGVGGKSNYGARFNGSSSYIDTNYLLPADNTFSFSWWMNAEVPVGDDHYIVNNGNGTGHDGTFAMYHTSDGKFKMWIGANGSGYAYGELTLDVTGSWMHLAVSVNGSTATVYKNGSSAGTISLTPHNTAGILTLIIGRLGHFNGRYFEGDLDQFRIFNKAISAAEVSELYGNGAGEIACKYTSTTDIVNYPTGTTPVAYYKLDNSSEDFSTGGNDGTDTNIEYRFGRYGQAAVFNNDSAITTSFNIGRTNDFTISFWIKDITDSNYGSYADKWVMGVYNNDYIPINYNKTSGKVSYLVHDGTTLLGTLQTPVLDDNWHHIVFTQDINVETKLYVDGVLQTSETVSHTSMAQRRSVSGGTGFYFGQNPSNSSTDLRLKGSVDQVRIYSTALSASQVTELYNEKPEADTSTFKTVLYEGNSSTQYISNVGFQPDFVWIKERTNASAHALYDSVRGKQSVLLSNGSNAATDQSSDLGLESFDANGFTVDYPNSGDFYINRSSQDYVAWVWKGGGDAVSNTDGTITSSVSANTAAGFSIVKYAGNNSVSATVGHGLSDAEMIILKDLTVGTNEWRVWHKDLNANSWLYLSLSLAQVTAATDGGIRYVDSNTFGFINGTTAGVEGVNYNSSNYIAYVWKSVSGVSKIGSYTGDGTTSGKIIYTTDDGTSSGSNGFEPSFLLTKPVGPSGGYWYILDNRRSTTNPRNDALFPNDSLAEISSTNYNVDFLSTGFELKNNTIGYNTNNEDYIYMAFK